MPPLRDLLELGRSLQMEPLVEVHSRAELDRAIAAGAKIIGVNNRDLRDFSVRLETSLELVESIPDDCIAVSESGLHSHADLARLRVGRLRRVPDRRKCMKSADPGASLRKPHRGPTERRPPDRAMPKKPNPKVKVKICGITNWPDARRAVEAGADFLGFNFYPPSPRYITPAKARRIVQRLPKEISAVGVFVNESEDTILDIAPR